MFTGMTEQPGILSEPPERSAVEILLSFLEPAAIRSADFATCDLGFGGL